MEMNSVLKKIVDRFIEMDQVVSVVIGGSGISGQLDKHSDVDLYIYAGEVLPYEKRKKVFDGIPGHYDWDLTFFDPGDIAVPDETGVPLDVMYRDLGFLENDLKKRLEAYQADLGYSTCFLYHIIHSEAVYDKGGWFKNLQKKADVQYPDQLVESIIRRNYPLLNGIYFSYTEQIELSVKRKDLVSLNHRITAYLASYFDIIFAVNRKYHPGEKRLLKALFELECPEGSTDLIRGLIISLSDCNDRTIKILSELNENMTKWLRSKTAV